MFARSYVYLDHTFADVRDVTLDSPSSWLVGLDGDSGEQILTRVGVRIAAIPIHKRVRFHLEGSRASAEPSRIVFPVSWEATGGPALFPDMQGDLEIEPFGPERTQITLSVTYRPPLGALGEVIDRALLHRLADATIQDFVQRLAGNIDRLLAETHKLTGDGK